MNRIHVLSEHVANKIAAGEVVERPASVVKELLENSLDAEATQIDVEIRGGGRGLIQVSDNGAGMSREDARLAFDRHATSKIKELEDIYAIQTLGFRGEALPSIAAVSHVELVTAEKGAKEGTRLEIEAGKVISHEAAPPADGTRISVANIFFNTPARRKFLKGERSEMNQIFSTVTLAALSHQRVGFRLTEMGKTLLEIPQQSDLSERLRILFGKEFSKEVLPLRARRNGIKIKGVIGKPSLNRGNRLSQFFFVNARPIQNRNLNFSLSLGFETLMPVNRFPVGVIFIEVDPDKVDVNIHPAKREVRFSDEEAVRSLLVRGVKEALGEANLSPSPKKIQRQKLEILSTQEKGFLQDAGQVEPTSFSSRIQEQIVSYMGKEEVSEKAASAAVGAGLESAPTVLKVLGAIADTYIVCETTAGLSIIDQHAAHERLLFEQVMLDFSKAKVETQQLLLPEVVELTAAEAALLEPYVVPLNKIGFSISSFGATSFLVDALPQYFRTNSVTQLVREMVGEIEAWGTLHSPDKMREKLAAMISCKAAVKARDRLKPEEMEKLSSHVFSSLLNKTCPHGRPIVIQMTGDQLAREFKRK